MAWKRLGFESPKVHTDFDTKYPERNVLTNNHLHGILGAMENETPVVNNSSSKILPIAIVVVIVVVIIVGAFLFTSKKGEEQQESAAGEAMEHQTIATPTEAVTGSSSTESAATTNYKDGTYKAEGDYVSPGGAESMDVTLTLKDGVVTDANVVANATRPTSKQMQASFIGGYKEQVVGKKLNEINLTKVAMSSLAPKGFNDAVEKIKTEAKI